ncbi:MAG: histidine phosphatase family protein [Elusimicrobiota bacterium]|nr:MAG: histidine phosphatase family protein [Elusimicrobiota bacterium]
MKRIYLMRHGHSLSTSEARVSKDALRPLSDKGRADVRAMAAEIAGRGGKPSLILHSPLLRAVQTAAEAAAVLKPSGGAAEFLPLDNTRPAEELARELALRGVSAEEVLAVGHQPQIGELAAMLGRRLFEFTPATVVALELEPAPRPLWAAGPEAAG